MITNKDSPKSSNKQRLKIKTLICQLDAKQKEIDYNIKRCQTSLLKYTKADKLDVVLFPEMAFTGYHFKDKEDIKPYLEESTKGITFKFCSNVAKILNCHVMCGYPEIFIDSEQKEHYYNSLYVINRKGELLLNYRKHHLYETDHRWAEEGDNFKTIELVNTDGVTFKAAVAICMDINCYEFLDPSKYELAEFCKKEKVDAIFFSAAWVDGEVKTLDSKSINRMLNYWLNRLGPMLDTKPSSYNKNFAFFCADRVGKEEETTFTGCSCALKVNPIEMIGVLDKRNEGYLCAEVSLEN